jgi:hypothetical protein
VSGGKKIKACGRTYFVADTTVRFMSNMSKIKNIKVIETCMAGNNCECRHILFFHEHERLVL